MAVRTASDILSSESGDSVEIKTLVGQNVTVVGFTIRPPGKFAKPWVVIEVVTSAGDEINVRTGATAVIQQLEELEAGGHLPQEVLIDTYPTDKGNPGFVFRNPVA
jgi:hypothetical protein